MFGLKFIFTFVFSFSCIRCYIHTQFMLCSFLWFHIVEVSQKILSVFIPSSAILVTIFKRVHHAYTVYRKRIALRQVYNEIISPSSSTIKVFLEIFPWQTIEFVWNYGRHHNNKKKIIVGFTIVGIFQIKKNIKKWN